MTDSTDAQPEGFRMETHDEKGRPLPGTMTERDMLTEIMLALRAISDTVEELSESPMVSTLMKGGNPLMALMGRG